MAKRLLDLMVSAVLIILTLPLMLFTWVVVRWKIGTPVFFCQDRPGLNGRIFKLLKFRTMRDIVGADGQPLPDKDRLPPAGAWIRRSSLDELPQLFNVLLGEMSLVGPRPLLVRYLPRYSGTHARRHEVKPGVTGWAQVNGRNAISWEQKLELDVYYVDHNTFWFDIRILVKTFVKVIQRSGISAEGEVTNVEFLGSAASPIEEPVQKQ